MYGQANVNSTQSNSQSQAPLPTAFPLSKLSAVAPCLASLALTLPIRGPNVFAPANLHFEATTLRFAAATKTTCSLVSLAAPSIIFVTTKVLSRQTRVCHDKARLLSQQKYACRNKTVVTTNVCHDKHHFVATKVLSRKTYFFRDQRSVLSRQNMCLSRQKYACRDKKNNNKLHNKTSVMTSTLLSRQKTCFVATKMILVAALANDSLAAAKLMLMLYRFTPAACHY